MSLFRKAFLEVGGYEGGYVDDPNDTGGETYMGISRNANPHWKGWLIIDGYKHKLSFPNGLERDHELQDEVAAFFKKNYWDVFRLDDIDMYNIVYEVYEQAVNLGVQRTCTHIQYVCNALNYKNKYGPDLAIDNRIGTNTRNRLRAIATSDEQTQSALLNGLNSMQGCHYVRLGNRTSASSDYRKYTKGWLSKRNKGYTYE